MINDLILGQGQVTPENHPLIVMLDFFYRLVTPYNKNLIIELAKYIKTYIIFW